MRPDRCGGVGATRGVLISPESASLEKRLVLSKSRMQSVTANGSLATSAERPGPKLKVVRLPRETDENHSDPGSPACLAEAQETIRGLWADTLIRPPQSLESNGDPPSGR